MKRRIISMLLATTMVLTLVGCGNKAAQSAEPAATEAKETEGATEVAETEAGTEAAATADSGLVDGKFPETKKITVEVFDRANDGGSDPVNNMYTDYIKAGMLDKYNVEVEFVAVPRWTEVEEINNLLAAGTAPDVCLTYDYASIQTYAGMDAVYDLAPYIDGYKDILPNLWGFLGDTNLYWDKDPETGAIYAIEGKRANTNRTVTFVRGDWLKKLNMEEPKTTDEFHDMLVAFKDNADTLLGADASKMVPYSMSTDVGWRASALLESMMDPDIADKELYVNGFDERYLTENGIKEGTKILNQWYNEGLIWNDFALHTAGDTAEDDMMKAGYVGAICHNWDYVYRNGDDSIQASIQRVAGEDAGYIPIECFDDKNGGYNKYSYSTAGDRKIFFPTTNDEPVASMLYLEYITSPEVIQYLQLGDEGVTYKVLDDGAYETIAATGEPIMNSAINIDYTITCNGLHLMDDELTLKSLSHSYAGIDPALIVRANEICNNDAQAPKNVRVPYIEAQEGIGPAMIEKRDIIFDTSVSAKEADFDSVWDSGMEDYLSSGGQAVIDERTEKWEATFGDVDTLPAN